VISGFPRGTQRARAVRWARVGFAAHLFVAVSRVIG
jgi:hypothetical protein